MTRQPQAEGRWPTAFCNAEHHRLTLRLSVAVGLGCLLAITSGCSAFGLGNTKLVQDLQAENDRLLAEFRAERDRREELEQALRRSENRLAESEKLLAQRYTPSLGRASANTARMPNNSLAPYSSEPTGNGSYGQDASDSDLRWQRRISK